MNSNTSSKYQLSLFFHLFLLFMMSFLNNVDVVCIPSLPNMDFFEIDKGSFTIKLNINCIFPNHVSFSKPSTGFVVFPTIIDFQAYPSLNSCKLPPMLSIEFFSSASSIRVTP